MNNRSENDSEGIRTPAGRAQWISSPSPSPLGHAVHASDVWRMHLVMLLAGSPVHPMRQSAQIVETNALTSRLKAKVFTVSAA